MPCVANGSRCWCWVPGHVDLRRLGVPGRADARVPPISRSSTPPRRSPSRCRRVKLLHERMSPAQWRRGGGAGRPAGRHRQGRPRNLLAVRFVRGDLWILAAAVPRGRRIRCCSSAGPRHWGRASGWWPHCRRPAGAVALHVWEVLCPAGTAAGCKALGLVLAGGRVAGRTELRRLFVPAARTGRLAHGADAVPDARLRRRCWPGGCWARCPGWYHAVGAALILPSIALATRR
jgi:hypothetical protein